MGFLSRLFGSPSGIERQLEDEYVPTLEMMGMSPSEARSTLSTLFEQVRKQSEDESTAGLPQNFGDVMLQREHSDEKISAMLGEKRREGVTDDDIRWWWNMHDLERRMMLQIDDLHRIAAFMKHKEEDGLGDDEAAYQVRKFFPIFGDPGADRDASGEDAPLPYELKDRINIYVQRRAATEKDTFKREVERATSCNAFLRSEIRAGRI